MRITEAQKSEVERRILAQARELLSRRAPGAVNTREVAEAAGIAHGTLFNYFKTREELGLALIERALADGETRERLLPGENPQTKTRRAKKGSAPRCAPTLAESLFTTIAADLTALRGLRELCRTLTGHMAFPGAGEERALRVRDFVLARLNAQLERRGLALPAVTTSHLVWSLYVGLLSFWAADDSPAQEDTLALLDETSGAIARIVSPTMEHRP